MHCYAMILVHTLDIVLGNHAGKTCPTFLSLIFRSKSCIQNCLNSSIRDTVLVATATRTISNMFFLSQGNSHNNIVKLQSDNIRDKKIIFLVLDHLNNSWEMTLGVPLCNNTTKTSLI